MNTAFEQNLELMRQGIELLERLDDEIYASRTPAFESSSSVGPHLRHCVDFYRCLTSGVEARRIDYDARQRRGEIEGDRSAGLAALQAVASDLEAIRDLDPHLDLEVKLDTPADAPDAWSRSTLRRELQGLVGHTVHHFALIAMILRRDGFDPGREFGVAPSTLRHWAREETVA